MKFLVPNYSCLQYPWLGGYRPQIPVLSVLNWICYPPEQNSWVRHWRQRRLRSKTELVGISWILRDGKKLTVWKLENSYLLECDSALLAEWFWPLCNTVGSISSGSSSSTRHSDLSKRRQVLTQRRSVTFRQNCVFSCAGVTSDRISKTDRTILTY